MLADLKARRGRIADANAFYEEAEDVIEGMLISVGGALAMCNGNRGRDQSENQVRDVGGVLPRCSLGVLFAQPDFIGNTSRIWGEERAKHWRTRQCEASEIPLGVVTRRGHTRSGATGISRPASRVCGRCLGNTSRGTRGTTLAGLRLQQYELQCATFLLLASGWTPEEHKNGSLREAVADASEPEAGIAGVEVTKSLQPAGRFRLLFGTAERKQTARSSFGVEEENPTGIQEDRHHGCGLAHFSAHGGYHAGRDGRTPTHDPRLLASQQSARHQQVPSGNDKEQAFSTGKARGCHPAWRSAFGKQIKPNPLTSEMTSFPNCVREESANLHVRNAYWTQTDPDCFCGFSVNHSKEWRGRRDSNPRPLP